MNTQQALHRVGIDQFIEAFDDGVPNFYDDILGEVIADKQAFYRFQIEGDFTYATVVNEGSPGSFDDFRAPYSLDVTPLKRQIGWASSTESLEGDIYGILKKALPKLKESLRATKEQAVANQVNNFTSTASPYVCADGLALISTAHLTETGTWANRPAADISLSYLALEQALQELRDTVSHRGKPMPIVGPFVLIVPNELEGLANRIVTSMQMPQSATNDPNWAKRRIATITSNPWLTDVNNWGLQVVNKAKRPIKMVVRRKPTMHSWYDGYTDSQANSSNEIYSVCNPDARGFWGTAPS
jgi:hypothetical protein